MLVIAAAIAATTCSLTVESGFQAHGTHHEDDGNPTPTPAATSSPSARALD